MSQLVKGIVLLNFTSSVIFFLFYSSGHFEDVTSIFFADSSDISLFQNSIDSLPPSKKNKINLSSPEASALTDSLSILIKNEEKAIKNEERMRMMASSKSAYIFSDFDKRYRAAQIKKKKEEQQKRIASNKAMQKYRKTKLFREAN